MTDARIVLTTFPNPEEARQIGTALLERQLVACLNFLPSAESLYRWKGKIMSETETLAMIKTTEENLADLEATFKELHPYEVPEFLVLPVGQGSEDYLKWLGESC